MEFSYVSDMMREDKETFSKFVNEMIEKSTAYLNMVKVFDETVDAVRIMFYEIDGDNFGYDVFKWMVKYEPSDNNSIVFRGYETETMHELVHEASNEIEFRGNYEEIMMYINSEKFEEMTQEQFDRIYFTLLYQQDNIKEWIGDIEGFKIEYNPNEK